MRVPWGNTFEAEYSGCEGPGYGSGGMSVLYKALEKAARQNARGGSEAAGDDSRFGGSAASSPESPLTPPRQDAVRLGGSTRRSRGRAAVRVLALLFLVVSAGALGAMVLFQDEVERLLVQTTGGASSMTAPPAHRTPAESARMPVPADNPVTETKDGKDGVVVADRSQEGPLDQPGQTDHASALPLETDPRGEAATAPTPSPSSSDTPAHVATINGAQAPAHDADRPLSVTPEPAEDTIALLMAEGAARRGLVDGGSVVTPNVEADTPTRDRVTAEDNLHARWADSAALATSAPVTVNHFAPETDMATVSVSTVPAETRESLADGYRALLRGNYAAALNAYDAVLTREPDNISALSGRAAALHKLGMGDEARAAYERVLARDPGNREALTNMIALIGDANPSQALTELERLEAVAPDFSPIPAQMGMLYARLGRVGDALGALRRAVALSPGNALYHYNIAVIADRAGNISEAARAYERVLRLMDGGSVPGGLRAQPIRDRLRYLRARL